LTSHTNGLGRYAIRECGPADVPVLAHLRHALAEEQAGEAVEDADFARRFADWFERESNQRITWLAEVASRPVGMLNLLVFTRMPRPRVADQPSRATQWGYIANAYVEAHHRDRGIGAALLAAATRYADRRGFARLLLSPSERSIPFYERAGFETATSLLVRTNPATSEEGHLRPSSKT
jgi:GNAT superfamily N-acetyltransferase